MKECILTIDLGTSGPKVALVTIDSEVIGWDMSETPLIVLADGGVEQDANDWWAKISDTTQRLLSRKDLPEYKIIAVAVTSQWSCVVPVNENGHALCNAISWLDTRGADVTKRLFDGLIKVDGYEVYKLLRWLHLSNGMPGSAGKDTIGHILYIKEAMPELYQKTYKFLEAKDYINARLTGRLVTAQDAVTLYWLTDNRNSQKVSYHPYLLKVTGIDKEKLPDILLSTDIIGELLPEAARQLGLNPGLPVVAGTPDVHSALLGSGGIDDYDGHLYLGTSSWLTCHTSKQKVSPATNMATIPSPLPGKYFIGNSQESAGYCLTHFARNILFPESEVDAPKEPQDLYPWLSKLAATAPAGSERVIYTPWIMGERTPVENKTIRGGFHNISGSVRRAHLARSVYEGVAYNSRWLMEAVESLTGRSFPYLRILGGGAISDLWCQIHADVLNREIRRVAEPRLANLRGVALLAAHSLGRLSIDEMSQKIAIEKVFKPENKNRSIYDDNYTAFRSLYKVEKKIFGRLNYKAFQS